MDRAGQRIKNRYWLRLLIIGLALSFISGFRWSKEPGEFQPVQEDEIAERYCPIIVQAQGIEPEPGAIYYRMAYQDKRIFIAYHIVWAYEKGEGKGLEKLWNKLFYTGGLKLQKVIFGPSDVEAIELVVDKESGEIIRLRYEQEGHQGIERSGQELAGLEKPYFEVTTWNHMFELISKAQISGKKVYNLKPEYLTEELWRYYKITKKHNHLLSQPRAHFSWEKAPEE